METINFIALMVNFKDDFNAYKLSKCCLETGLINKVVIVSNSRNFSVNLEHEKNIILLYGNNSGGYAYGNNVGLKYISENFVCKYVAIMNTDVVIDIGTFKQGLLFYMNQTRYSFLSLEMKNLKGDIECNYWHIKKYFDCMKNCFYVSKLFHEDHFFNKIIKLQNMDIIDVDVLRGTLMFCNFSALKEVNYFDDNSFLYWEEDKLFFKLNNIGYKSGVLKGLFFLHNHPLTNSQMQLKNLIKKQKWYYFSMYDYCKTYLKINLFKRIILKSCIYFAICEKVVYGFFRKFFKI